MIDCISDLHGHYPKLDGGDLLIIAGDLTRHDTLIEYEQFDKWLRDLQYRKKVIIAGNHDNHLQNGYSIKYGEYLCDSGTEYQNFWTDKKVVLTAQNYKIWGSPWTKRFEGMNSKCMAFTVETDEELADKWKLIPNDIEILVTHCPPYAFLDEIYSPQDRIHLSVGSPSLLSKRVDCKPRLHIFGHVHEGYGIFEGNNTKFVNASHVNERYEPINQPIRIEL